LGSALHPKQMYLAYPTEDGQPPHPLQPNWCWLKSLTSPVGCIFYPNADAPTCFVGTVNKIELFL
jgi:hypothetical protein